MKPFQLVFIGVMIFLVVAAIFTFALTGGKSNSSNVASAPALVWGTLPKAYFDTVISQLTDAKQAAPNMIYVEKKSGTFDQDLLEALADGKGPDGIIVTQAEIFKNLNRISTIPYTSFPERTYLDTFIPEAHLFQTHDGLAAIPIMVNPLVMYWNKDILVSNNIVLPPKYWDDVISLIPTLTQSDQAYNIQKSTIALGEYQNVAHAKDIISALFLQTGDPITYLTYNEDRKKNILEIVLRNDSSNKTKPAQSALNFYTQFADPVKTTYTWNRSLNSSTDQFLSGNTAFYIGYASEYSTLLAKNPNLNFDVTTLPQPRTSVKKSTFANMYGLAVLSSAKNKVSAFNAAIALSGQDAQKGLVSVTNLPPVRLDLLQQPPAKAALGTFYTAALQSDAWIDPNPQLTETIFKNMIESILSGTTVASQAADAADSQMKILVQL